MGDEATGLIGCAQKGVPYADEGGPWLEVFSDPADREVMGEDGEPKTVNVDETAIYWEVQSCFANKKEVRTGNFPSGIWFGGKKYTVTREDETENDPRIKYVNMAEGGGQSRCRRWSDHGLRRWIHHLWFLQETRAGLWCLQQGGARLCCHFR